MFTNKFLSPTYFAVICARRLDAILWYRSLTLFSAKTFWKFAIASLILPCAAHACTS